MSITAERICNVDVVRFDPERLPFDPFVPSESGGSGDPVQQLARARRMAATGRTAHGIRITDVRTNESWFTPI